MIKVVIFRMGANNGCTAVVPGLSTAVDGGSRALIIRTIGPVCTSSHCEKLMRVRLGHRTDGSVGDTEEFFDSDEGKGSVAARNSAT